MVTGWEQQATVLGISFYTYHVHIGPTVYTVAYHW